MTAYLRSVLVISLIAASSVALMVTVPAAALPMTTTGKVQRKVLRLQEEARARSAG